MTDYLITAPTVEPITIDDVKLHIRQDASILTLEDGMITRLITSARQRAEHLTGRAFLQQTRGIVLDTFPNAIELTKTPVIDVVEVKYLDAANQLQTLSSSDYVVDSFGTTGYIVPAYGKTWPSTYPEINAVRVQYRAGYGTTADSVPECVKDWMLLIIEDLYRNRGATVDKEVRAHPLLDCMLDPVTVVRYS
jgi:uncharacterized phiE125 gp8 family phage protein